MYVKDYTISLSLLLISRGLVVGLSFNLLVFNKTDRIVNGFATGLLENVPAC